MGYVYKITNTVNNKSYIGISIHEPEKDRIQKHLSGRGNRIIANAIKKYGRDAFTYEVLEENVFDEFLPDLEIAYIEKFNTVAPHGYNLTHGGDHAIPSEDTRRKMSETRKGKPLSTAHRRKISESLRGEKHPNFGKKFSAKMRQKLSETKKGKKRKPHSAETRRKISEANKGKPRNFGRTHSVATRRKISEAQRGEKNHNFGKKHSEAHRRKISKAMKGEKNHFYGKTHLVATRRKISEAQKGKNLSVEHRRKISESLRGEKNHNFGKTFSLDHRRKISESRKRLSEYVPAHEFFLSLPADMSLKEKRKLLYAKFPNVKKRRIQHWVSKWVS